MIHAIAIMTQPPGGGIASAEVEVGRWNGSCSPPSKALGIGLCAAENGAEAGVSCDGACMLMRGDASDDAGLL